jgi:hypothetical protein
MEAVRQVRIHRRATSAREYDAVSVTLGDLHLYCDLVNDRQIRLAERLARSHSADFQVAPELRARVHTALGHLARVPPEFRGIVEETAAILAEVAK